MSEAKQPSELAIQYATEAWTKPLTQHIEMDTRIAIESALIIDRILSKAYLGNATTKELIYELSARCDTGSINQGGDYKTAEPIN